MNYKHIHTFWGSEVYPHRHAEVIYHGNKEYYSVKFFDKKNLIEERKMVTVNSDGTETVHSEQYAEDAAENWCMGYIP